jgi:protein ImuB
VTPAPPDTIFIDVAGSSHLLKGDAALLKVLQARLSSVQLAARAAIADTPGIASASSHLVSRSLMRVTPVLKCHAPEREVFEHPPDL